MKLRIILGVVLLAATGGVLAGGDGSADNFAGGGDEGDDCGTSLTVTSLTMSATTLGAGIDNPSQELQSGYFLPAISIGSTSFVLAVPLQLDGLSAVDVSITFPEPFALTGFGTKGCRGQGITEGPDPLEIRVTPRNEEEPEEGEE